VAVHSARIELVAGTPAGGHRSVIFICTPNGGVALGLQDIEPLLAGEFH